MSFDSFTTLTPANEAGKLKPMKHAKVHSFNPDQYDDATIFGESNTSMTQNDASFNNETTIKVADDLRGKGTVKEQQSSTEISESRKKVHENSQATEESAAVKPRVGFTAQVKRNILKALNLKIQR